MRAIAIPAVLVLVTGCGSRDDAAGRTPRPEVPVPRDRKDDPVSVQFHVVEERPGTPPLVRMKVDVVVLNHASQPRWVLLPSVAGQAPGMVDGVQVETWGDMTVAAWSGTGGFRALRIAADARVQLDGMPIAWWRHDDDPQPALVALAARELRVAGQPAEQWLPQPPSRDGSGGPAAGTAARVALDPGGAEVATELIGPIEVREVPWPRD